MGRRKTSVVRYHTHGLKSLKENPIRFQLEPLHEKLDQVLPTPTDIELKLAQLMGWQAYELNMPLRNIYTHITKEKVLNVDTGMIEYKIAKSKQNGVARIAYGTKRVDRNQLSVRWCEYRHQIAMPDDFEDHYPYLYWIARDMFWTSLKNHKDNMRMQRMNKELHELVKLVVSILYQFHQFVIKIPGIKDYILDPVNIKAKNTLQDFEDILLFCLPPPPKKSGRPRKHP